MSLGTLASAATSLTINLDDLSSEFNSYITNKLKIELYDSYAYRDPDSGDIIISCIDQGKDSFTAIFTFDKYGSPGCSLLDSNDDEIGWMQLDGIAPVSDNKIDISSWSWLRKSVLVNLLNIANVNYTELMALTKSSIIGESITEAFSMRGKKRVSVVSHIERSRKLDDRQLLILGAARRLHYTKKFN